MLSNLFYALRDWFLYGKSGTVGEHVRYEQIKGIQLNVGGCIWAASQAMKAKSGRFVYMNDGAVTLCDADTNPILGWAQDY